MRGEVHILVNCPIDTFLKETQHSGIDIDHWHFYVKRIKTILLTRDCIVFFYSTGGTMTRAGPTTVSCLSRFPRCLFLMMTMKTIFS